MTDTTTPTNGPPTSALQPVYGTELVAPWTTIHVTKANEQRSLLSLALDRALADGNHQVATALAHAMHALAEDVNGFYGR